MELPIGGNQVDGLLQRIDTELCQLLAEPYHFRLGQLEGLRYLLEAGHCLGLQSFVGQFLFQLFQSGQPLKGFQGYVIFLCLGFQSFRLDGFSHGDGITHLRDSQNVGHILQGVLVGVVLHPHLGEGLG